MPTSMRLLPVLVLPALVAGCAGPERKLARGIQNVTEFTRMGEVSRSVEQTTLWEGAAKGRTLGFIRGFNRGMARTLIGVAEVATFYAPTPTCRDGDTAWTYDATYTPDGPLYPDYSVATYGENWGGMRLPEYGGTPDSFSSAWPATSALDTDNLLGITGGAIISAYPFGKFTINEQ